MAGLEADAGPVNYLRECLTSYLASSVAHHHAHGSQINAMAPVLQRQRPLARHILEYLSNDDILSSYGLWNTTCSE